MRLSRVFIFCVVVAGIFLFTGVREARASHGTHLVISEVQITGGAGLTKNDFVELYNPTGAAIDLNGIRLVKRTATGTTDTTLKSWTESAMIPAHGYYLWANSDFVSLTPTADAKTTGTISDDNSVALRQGAEDTGTIIDAVGWGAALNGFVEGSVFSENPGANISIERKPGGSEGNGEDTGNNANDFVLQSTPNPKNSTSSPMPAIATPTPPESSPPAGEENSGNAVQATPGDVLINEFVPDPTDTIEWIELYNTTSGAIDLTGWKILDGTGATVKTLSGTILAQGFTSADLSSARLNNSGDIIVIKSANDLTIDAVSYGNWNDETIFDNAQAPTKSGQSVARKTNGGDTGNDKTDFSLSDTPTKSASNVITITNTISVGGTSVSQVPFVPKLQILINEFVSDPEDGPEWVEIYNVGNLSVDLEGWWIEDGTEAKTKLTGTIVPEQFIIFEDIAGNLNNAGDIIRLKNEKGEMTDRVTFGTWEDGTPSDNAPTASDPNSVARKIDGQDTDNDKADFEVSTKPTKGKVNVITEPQKIGTETTEAEGAEVSKDSGVAHESARQQEPVLSPATPSVSNLAGKLFISEFIPNPDGSDDMEWIELYFDGAASLSLKGIQLDDGEGGSKPFVFDTETISPRAFLKLPKSKTNITLNNDADEVRLLDTAGHIFDSVEYEESAEGVSYAKNSKGQWQWTARSTPGAVNEIVVPEGGGEKSGKQQDEGAAEAIDLNSVRAREKGTQVRVSGIVSVPPDLFGKNIFYLSTAAAGQAGSGIQIYASKGTPPLALGDRVIVEGKVSEIRTEARITVSKKEWITKQQSGKAPTAHPIVEPLDEEYEGWFVSVTGTVIDVASTKMVIDDGNEEILISIKKATGIDSREFVPGMKVRISGIVVPSGDEYSIVPRFESDIEILGNADTAHGVASESSRTGETAQSSPYAKTTLYTGGAVALSALALRRRTLFTTGWRAAWFLFKRGKGGGGKVM
ncbi:MAG: lamin tail domain-containing protein [bacterium]|nr:lamin tail domain-containing protein [bacterium]